MIDECHSSHLVSFLKVVTLVNADCINPHDDVRMRQSVVDQGFMTGFRGQETSTVEPNLFGWSWIDPGIGDRNPGVFVLVLWIDFEQDAVKLIAASSWHYAKEPDGASSH